MEIIQDTNTYVSIVNADKTISNEMISVYAKSGYGKSLQIEACIEEFHRAGYTILILSDVKDEIEFGFAMFPPKKPYHVHILNKIGKPVKTQNVKIYHPFTFDIPTNTLLPEINFYGFSLKELKRAEWSMIAESSFESDTIRLLLNSSQQVNKNEGLYSFLHFVRDSIRGEGGKKNKGEVRYDPKNFYLDTTTATAKSLQDISSYLLPFKKHYFLVDDNSPLKLDWKNILNNNQDYHFFTSYWIDDEKLKEFCILSLFNAIIRNKKFAKHPLLIVIPEIRYLVPFKPEGYKKFLAYGIKKNLSVMRNQGRGMSGLFDSQVWSDVDENVRNSSTFTVFGEMGGAGDMERVSKALNYKRDTRDYLKKMPEKNTYLIQGKEDLDTFTLWLPAHMHAEPEYNFFEMYKEYFPERLKNYSSLYNNMENTLKTEENKFKELIKKRVQEDKHKQDALRKERENKGGDSKKVEELQQKAEALKNMAIEEKQKAVYVLKKQKPEASWREIGKEMGLHHLTAKKYFETYEQKSKADEKKDFEDTALTQI